MQYRLGSPHSQYEISNFAFSAAATGGHVSPAAARARVGVDVGGTFTDVVVHAADGTTSIRKLLSTPPGYDEAVVAAVADSRPSQVS